MDGVRKYSDTAEMSAEQQARIIETLTEQIETEEMSDKRLALILDFWAVCRGVQVNIPGDGLQVGLQAGKAVCARCGAVAESGGQHCGPGGGNHYLTREMTSAAMEHSRASTLTMGSTHSRRSAIS